MSGLSLGWQAATYVLTGGRVKAELRVGAMNAGGLVTMPVSSLTSDSMKALQAQGYGQPVAAVPGPQCRQAARHNHRLEPRHYEGWHCRGCTSPVPS